MIAKSLLCIFHLLHLTFRIQNASNHLRVILLDPSIFELLKAEVLVNHSLWRVNLRRV